MSASPSVRCPHVERCAGCPAIGLPYDEQLARKRADVEAALRRYPLFAALGVERTEGAEQIEGYRVRAKLVVGRGPSVGLYERASHEVVDIPACRVLSPALSSVVSALRSLMAEPPVGAGAALVPRAEPGGALLAVDCREAAHAGTSRVLVTLVLAAEQLPAPSELEIAAKALLQATPAVVGVAASRRRSDSVRVLGDSPKLVAGEGEVLDSVGAVAHLATHGAFVQAHRGQAAKLHRAIAAELSSLLGSLEGRRVLDLYGGSGAIALSLAERGARVTLVEAFEPAAKSAERVGAGRIAVRVGDAADAAVEDAADAIVVNPPRRGLTPGVRDSLARLGPRAIVYVSCWPETLARDLHALSLHGYRPRRVVPFDMIPLSDQVETLVLLEPADAPKPEILAELGDYLVVDKPAHEALVPDVASGPSLRGRVRALDGFERAVAVFGPERLASGIALFARTAAAEARFATAAALSPVRVVHLALVRGTARDRGRIRRPERRRGRAVAVDYEVVGRLAGHSLLRAAPEDFRKARLGAELAAIGHPVVGDVRDGHAPTNRHFFEKLGLDRAFLHLHQVELEVPGTGERLLVKSPVAPDLVAVSERLQGSPAPLG